ncbi:hypothetical protein NDU88_001479 [Pleurodeles waltl]|uniref:Uncharacterized protein n=1 Tax=Pleurodeles waltl TaxID=8319 RepID=A0AAV7KQD4_PLEWA|nr:hypothetical protein NDU88_001479 [Pleurodeles waltl]
MLRYGKISCVALPRGRQQETPTCEIALEAAGARGSSAERLLCSCEPPTHERTCPTVKPGARVLLGMAWWRPGRY